jgi:hypothetical protein
VVADDAQQALAETAPGFTLGVSVSHSPDLALLGLTETHLRMALGEVAQATLIAKGRLSYGGHLRDDGYTAFLGAWVSIRHRSDRPDLARIGAR